MLARAESTDPTLSNLTLVLASLVVLAIISFFGFLIIRSARLRRPAQLEVFVAFTILWIALASGSAIYDIITQMKWSQESTSRLQTGYYTPTEVAADAPAHPWPLYSAIAIAYLILLPIASRPIHYPPPPP